MFGKWRVLVLLLAIGGGLFYRQLNQLWGDLPAPTLDAQQWWSNKPAPKDYQAYLAKSSKIVENPLKYPDEVGDLIIYELCGIL